MIVVDVRTPGQIRATATFDAGGGRARRRPTAASIRRRCSARGTLAMTVEQGQTQQRYQGYVPLEDETLEAAAHTYFRQSEQIPTRIRLAVAEMYDRDAEGAARRTLAGGRHHRPVPAGVGGARRAVATCRPATCRKGASARAEPADDDAWVEAQALIDTVEDHELTDPSIAAERLLYRLFHERGVRVFEPMSLEENCSCSRERIEQVLRADGRRRRSSEAAASGAIEVRCEFCGAHYRFDPAEFRAAAVLTRSVQHRASRPECRARRPGWRR